MLIIFDVEWCIVFGTLENEMYVRISSNGDPFLDAIEVVESLDMFLFSVFFDVINETEKVVVLLVLLEANRTVYEVIEEETGCILVNVVQVNHEARHVIVADLLSYLCDGWECSRIGDEL